MIVCIYIYIYIVYDSMVSKLCNINEINTPSVTHYTEPNDMTANNELERA
jgi:hypothetical protein